VFEQCVARVRALGAPFFQVVHTYRMGPHSKGDDFRDAAEIALWRDEDPLVLARRVLAADEVAAMDERARAVVAACVSFADGAPAASHAFEMPGQVAGPPMEPPFAVTKQAYIKNINGALHEILGNDPAAFVMGEDLLDPYGGAFGATRGLSTQFPDRVITTPISEAGIAAWGVGGALEGGHPIIEIMFGDFLALAADQLLNHAPKYAWVSDDGVSVPMVVRTPMGGGRGYGPSHSQSIEKMFLGIPGLTVVAPSHLLEPGALLKRAAALKSPVLFIEHKLLYPRPVEAIVDGRMGDFYVRATQSVFPTLHLSLAEFERPDVAIVAYGGMTPLALELASALLHKEEVVADVIVPAQLSPMPTAEIAAFLGDCPVVITIEEGQKECGWGAEVVASIAGLQAAHGRRFLRFAAAYSPVPAAGSLEKKALPNLDVILAGIKRGL
jgi:2-oxoisovalerate dehydrogenase E1 component